MVQLCYHTKGENANKSEIFEVQTFVLICFYRLKYIHFRKIHCELLLLCLRLDFKGFVTYVHQNDTRVVFKWLNEDGVFSMES